MLKHILHYGVVLVMAMFISIAIPAFAEEAPVYDLDGGTSIQEDNSPDTEMTVSSSQPIDISGHQSADISHPSLTLEQRVARAEHQIGTLQRTDAPAKVETLQSEIQSLRGQVEQLTRQVQQMQTQQRTLYSDVDKRLANQQSPVVDKKQAVIPNETIPLDSVALKIKQKPPLTKTDQQPNVVEEQQIYQTAYDFIKAKKYENAIVALQGMLNKYPTGQFAANAHYWLGELYGLLGKNDQSAAEFSHVVKSYPDSPKVSDAQLKLGLIFAAQFKWIEAKVAFKKVVNHYPGTASARVASEQLRQIKIAGH